MIEHMFDHEAAIELLAGELDEDERLYRLTQAELRLERVEPDRHVLPDGFEDLPPGLFQTAIASSVDRTRLNGHDAVRLMQAEGRLASHFEAAKLASMAEVALSPGAGPSDPVVRDVSELEYASDEIAAALTLTRRAADKELELALSVTGRLRRVWEKLRQGLIDLGRVKVFDQQLGHLAEDTIDTVSDQILDAASDLTTGQLRARLARLIMEADPDGVDLGYEEGLLGRSFVIYANPDNTANVCGQSIASTDAAAISRKVNRIAAGINGVSDPRTIDQIRADVFVDLLLDGSGRGTVNDRGVVHLKVDVATLAELADTPGELAGYGPVIADIARKTAAAQTRAEWRYTITHEDGHVLDSGITRRRPTAEVRRRVEAEYETCVFRGCRMPASECDLDHRQPYAQGGSTHEHNLGPLCRHHHMAKHHAPWQQRRLPNGDHGWTSPLGHTYTTSGRSP